MSRKPSKVGKKYGMVTVIEYLGESLYKCKCDCGKVFTRLSTNLNDNSGCISCGCYAIKSSKERFKKSIKFSDNTSISNISSARNYKTNTSGKRGVFWDNKCLKWRANIMIQGKRYWLGSFYTFNEAVEARKEAEEKYYKPIISKFNKLNELKKRRADNEL
jgi:hypothetical protein